MTKILHLIPKANAPEPCWSSGRPRILVKAARFYQQLADKSLKDTAEEDLEKLEEAEARYETLRRKGDGRYSYSNHVLIFGELIRRQLKDRQCFT